MKVSVFLASCSRIDMLCACIDSLYYTKGDHEIEIVLVLDGYDLAEVRRIISRIDGDFILDYSQERRGALRCWNRGLELSTTGILIPAGDDQVFHEGWLDFALESHREILNGYGVVGMNDLAYDGNLQVSTMFLFDRRWCVERMGGIFAPPMLKYFCVDLWWNDKAKMLGEFYWCKESVVEHVHSAHNKRPVDSLDQEKMDAGWMEEDNRVYAEQKTLGLPVTWESII